MSGISVSSVVERNRALVIGAAAMLPLGVCAVLAAFRSSVTSTTSVLILVLVVVAASSTGDRLAGLVAALSSGLWFDFFLTKPYETPAIDNRGDIETTVLLVIISAAVGELALWGRRQESRASRRSGYLDGVLGTAEIIALRNDTPRSLIDHVAKQITQVLEIDGCRYKPGPMLDPRMPELGHQGVVTRQGHSLDVDSDGLPTNDEIAIAVRQGDKTVGHFLITAAARIARPSLEQRRVAILLADQVGRLIASSRE
jgi:K+-sensing histidine kinase KdpD